MHDLHFKDPKEGYGLFNVVREPRLIFKKDELITNLNWKYDFMIIEVKSIYTLMEFKNKRLLEKNYSKAKAVVSCGCKWELYIVSRDLKVVKIINDPEELLTIGKEIDDGKTYRQWEVEQSEIEELSAELKEFIDQ